LRRSIHPNGLLNRFVRDQRGVSAIIFAIVLPALIGFVGISVEVGLWFARKRSLQAAADAGAMAGALVLYQSGTWSDAQTAASYFAVRNGAVAANVTVNNPLYNPPITTGAYTADNAAVEVLITESQSLMFSALFLTSAVTVNARAVATAGTRALGCVVALSGSASPAVSMAGNAAMNLNNCGLSVNSTASDAFEMTNNTDLSASFANITGEYSFANNYDVHSTPVSEGTEAVADPFADLTNPTPSGACTETNYSSSGNETIGPGRYCGGLSIGVNDNITMTAGTYYVDGGTFTMAAGSTLTATSGVTIILTGSGSDWAELSLTSNTTMNITAPTSGTYAGIAIMQDPDAPTTAANNISANITMTVTGALYFPTAPLNLSSNTVIQSTGSGTTGCGLVVANTLTMASNSQINLNSSAANCDPYGVPTTTDASPTLVE
jgi:Flp pilus assembly protein TadG